MLREEGNNAQSSDQKPTQESGLGELFSFSEPTDDQLLEEDITEKSETTAKSEPTENVIFDTLPTMEDVTPDVIDEDNKKLGEPSQSGIDNIPIVQDVFGDGKDQDEATPKDIEDLPIVGDLMELANDTDQSTSKEFDKGVEDLPVVGDILDTVDTVNTQIIDEASPQKSDDIQTSLEKSTKSVKEVQEASPISPLTDEIVIDSSPKADKSAKDLEASPVTSEPVDADEDSGSEVNKSAKSIEEVSPKSQEEDEDKSPKIDEVSSKSPSKKSDFDVLSDLTREQSSGEPDKSVHSSPEIESLSGLSLSELQSHPVMTNEQYEAGTEVVAHLPDHHSMKTDKVAEQLVSKHLEDSSASSSDSDSGVSKMELTNVDHNSDEQHFTTQFGTSSADSNLFGATSDSNVVAIGTDTKTVNTEISKVKFQHGRKWAGLNSAAVISSVILLIAFS